MPPPPPTTTVAYCVKDRADRQTDRQSVQARSCNTVGWGGGNTGSETCTYISDEHAHAQPCQEPAAFGLHRYRLELFHLAALAVQLKSLSPNYRQIGAVTGAGTTGPPVRHPGGRTTTTTTTGDFCLKTLSPPMSALQLRTRPRLSRQDHRSSGEQRVE